MSLGTGLLYLTSAVSNVVFAQEGTNPNIQIDPNALRGVNPTRPVGTVLTNALTIIFILGALVVLFMLVIGAVQWITSGGDKEAVGKARSRITHALIGFAILALAAFLVTVVGQIVNINIFNLQCIPNLNVTGRPC
jgi:hypothetical protein